MNIIKVTQDTLKHAVGMGCLLFPHDTYDELFDIYAKCLATGREFLFLCEAEDVYIGYCHISIRRDYVNGTNSSPVLFLEAIYVHKEARGRGVARAFVDHMEEMARELGIKEMASDCLLENTDSEAFHKACGFREDERVICFVKEVSLVRDGNE